MGVPSSRTPVRVARGTYANLSTTNALAALQKAKFVLQLIKINYICKGRCWFDQHLCIFYSFTYTF